ncbi:unnamed protein product [uncultured bacterium]|nr:unnamed protein product [uncultured bacterium]
MRFNVTSALATIPWQVVVTCAAPALLCAVINPPLLTNNTLVLSDCQFVQLDVTSRVVPLRSAVRFDHGAQEATLLDYLHEVDHVAARVERLEAAITVAVQTAPARMRVVIDALQALRGIALVSAVTIASEVGELSRFAKPRQLMGYSGAVASEDSSGERTRRGGITKAGNAHLRRVVVEAGWAYRHRPAIGPALRKRQARVSADVQDIAWKARAPVAPPLPCAHGAREVQTASGNRDRSRTLGIHLGDRRARGITDG